MVYIASPYNHENLAQVELNYVLVTLYVTELVSKGITAISPITYGHTLLKFKEMPSTWEFWNKFCISILEKCDELWVYKIPGWAWSKGVTEEIEFAINNNIPIKYIEYNETTSTTTS